MGEGEHPVGAAGGRFRIGVDLGGTKTEVAAVDRNGGFVFRQRADTPRDDYPGTVATIARLVGEAERTLRTAGSVGVGIPGAISTATGTVKNANSTWLNGKPLLEDLQAALRRPLRIQNDANCLAVSEAADGAARGAHGVLALILGTGVGAGICIGNRLLTGCNAIAGEWGHNPLPPSMSARDETPGPPCWCGRRGCIETWLSGPALARDFALHASRPRAPTDRTPGAEEVFRLADLGDADAEQAVERWLDRLARSLAGVINLLDPDVVVMGGGLSNAGILYRELPRRVTALVFSDQLDTVFAPAAHGDSSGVRGAAWLWP